MQIKFNLQTFLINSFGKAATFLLINFKTRADNFIAFFLVNYFSLFLLPTKHKKSVFFLLFFCLFSFLSYVSQALQGTCGSNQSPVILQVTWHELPPQVQNQQVMSEHFARPLSSAGSRSSIVTSSSIFFTSLDLFRDTNRYPARADIDVSRSRVSVRYR